MKTNAEIIAEQKILIEMMSPDGGTGWIPGLDVRKPRNQARVVWSNGGGWDHVSISWSNRCPNWDEMCKVKKLFFYPEEVCVEFHPAESEYVNIHPYCLHIWRAQDQRMPTPASWMVGPKDNETLAESRARGMAEMNARKESAS